MVIRIFMDKLHEMLGNHEQEDYCLKYAFIDFPGSGNILSSGTDCKFCSFAATLLFFRPFLVFKFSKLIIILRKFSRSFAVKRCGTALCPVLMRVKWWGSGVSVPNLEKAIQYTSDRYHFNPRRKVLRLSFHTFCLNFHHPKLTPNNLLLNHF